jgi:hypothetical protein
MERIFGLTNGDDDKKPVQDNDDIGSGQYVKDGGMGLSANYGTKGFQEFGSGTRATLHGSEMVLPKNNVGELAKLLGRDISRIDAPVMHTTATETNNTTSMDMTTLNANTTELIDLNKKLAMHLNTLVTIGTMTEKNTKNTNNNLANLSGSLV